MSWHVKRTRISDGKAGYSRTFPSEAAAQREADAWNCAGKYARYGPASHTAEVIEGRTPAPAPCAGCGHARRNHVHGEGLCIVRSCRLCLIYRPAKPAKDGPGGSMLCSGGSSATSTPGIKEGK